MLDPDYHNETAWVIKRVNERMLARAVPPMPWPIKLVISLFILLALIAFLWGLAHIPPGTCQ